MATWVHVLTSCKSTAISEGLPRPADHLSPGVADDNKVAAADYGDVYYYNGEGLRSRGETEKRSGASIPVGHPLHEMTAQQRGEVDCTQALSGPGLATADDCEDGENPG